MGDAAENEALKASVWEEVIAILHDEIPEDPTRAIVDAVERVGKELANHFPRTGDEDDINELPDEVRYH